jgi:hypothetical protein
MKSTKNNLVNKKYGRMFKEGLLSQYNTFVKTSEDTTTKRLDSNKFYLTLNTLVLGLTSYLSVLNQKFAMIVASVIGILISLVWIGSISAYRQLNSAKFKVINEMEEYLPASPFKKEDEYLEGYYKLTKTEKYVPIIFLILYALVLLVLVLPFVIDFFK